MEGFVIDVEDMIVISANTVFVLIPHLTDVIDSPIPADSVDNDVFYFPVKNCQDIYSFVNLFNHKTSLKRRFEPSQISRYGSKDKRDNRAKTLHQSYCHARLSR